MRRLPIKGEVLVEQGARVEPDTVVARALLPGILQTVRVAESLGIEPREVPKFLRVQEGDLVEKDQLLAETKGFFGLFKGICKSPLQGTVEFISPATGHVGIRQPPTVIEVKAYVQGRVVEVLPEEGAIIETHGAFVQGIFGVGGERLGVLKMGVQTPDEVLTGAHLQGDLQGKIVVGGAGVTGEAIRQAAERGAVGIVVGGVKDSDLIAYLGHDLGVAITGQEEIPLSLIITEGFGIIRMADRTFQLLKSLEGRAASLNGATQIRAGVIRPEIIVPAGEAEQTATPPSGLETQQLEIGTPIRVIREPYFGKLGRTVALPSELVEIDSGAHVRVLEAELEDGRRVRIPRANVEIIVGA